MFDVEPRERSRGVPGDIGQEGRETGDVHSRGSTLQSIGYRTLCVYLPFSFRRSSRLAWQ